MWNNEIQKRQIRISPDSLEIVKRENDYILLNGPEELKTPLGNTLSSKDQRILQFILTELSLSREINLDMLSSYVVFSYLIDFIEKEEDFVLKNFHGLLEDDYFFKLKVLKHKPQIADLNLLDFFANNLYLNNVYYEGMHSIRGALNNFITNILGSDDLSDISKKNKFINFLFENYSGLPKHKKSLLNLLVINNHSSIIIPFLLISNSITAQQYFTAISFIEILFNSEMIAKAPETIIKESESNYFQILKLLDFLKYFDVLEVKTNSISDTIKQGENTNIEFKSSLRWNLKDNKRDTSIEHAVLKTVTSFLNSKGGNLLIGVKNDGAILGIEIDGFENEDKFLLHFWNLIRDSVGEEVSPYITTTIEKMEGKTICNVKCLRSSFPVFLKQKGFNEEFYIRIGPSCMSLSISDTIKYIENHFSKKE